MVEIGAPHERRTSHENLFQKWILHDDVIKLKYFPRYWPFVRGIHRWPVNSPHKGQWCRALMFSLICARTNGWVHNGDARDLRCYRVHYDVTVMIMAKLTERFLGHASIGLENSLSPVQHQAIIWTNAGFVLTHWSLGDVEIRLKV